MRTYIRGGGEEQKNEEQQNHGSIRTGVEGSAATVATTTAIAAEQQQGDEQKVGEQEQKQGRRGRMSCSRIKAVAGTEAVRGGAGAAATTARGTGTVEFPILHDTRVIFLLPGKHIYSDTVFLTYKIYISAKMLVQKQTLVQNQHGTN